MRQFDYLVVGSGVSGLWFALKAAEHGSVCVVTKRERDESNTRYAQGGVAAVMSVEDSVEDHIKDTLVAGAGLCDEGAVRVTVTEGPTRVRELIELGVQFSRDEDGEYDLGKEGGHTKRRVLHAGDITGAEIQRALVEAVHGHPKIELLEYHSAVDLITRRRLERPMLVEDRCLGAYVLDIVSGEVRTILARATILATGGDRQGLPLHVEPGRRDR